MKYVMLSLFLISVPYELLAQPAQSHLSLFLRRYAQLWRRDPARHTKISQCEKEVEDLLNRLIQDLPEGAQVTRADFLQYGCWLLYGCMQFCEGLAQMFRLMLRGTEWMRTWEDYIPSL